MRLTLKIWRQDDAKAAGGLESHEVDEVDPGMTVLDVLDKVNAGLRGRGAREIAFSQQCRKGSCGLCALVINGDPHGPTPGKAACQVQMRAFDNGSTLVIEPWRAGPFPPVRDLIVDRGALGRVLEAGRVPSTAASAAAASAGFCIECGACVAACKNASASLFVGAKLAEHASRPEPRRRVLSMVARMDAEGFGSCSDDGACEAACPKGVSVGAIAALNRAFLSAALLGPEP